MSDERADRGGDADPRTDPADRPDPRPEPDGGTATGTALGTATESAVASPLAVRETVAVARRELRVVVRTRWVLGLTLLFAAFAAGVGVATGSGVGTARYAAAVATMVELSAYVVPLAALALGYGTVVAAEERGSLDLLFALPLARWRVVVGKALGRGAALAGSLVVGLVGGGVALLSRAGLVGWDWYVWFVGSAVLCGLALLSVAVLVSTVARRSTVALGAALAAWAWFVLVHDLLALGAVVALGLPEAALTAAVLANPVDLFRVLALAPLPAAAGGFAGVGASAGVSPALAAAGLLAWTVLPTGAAAALLARR